MADDPTKVSLADLMGAPEPAPAVPAQQVVVEAAPAAAPESVATPATTTTAQAGAAKFTLADLTSSAAVPVQAQAQVIEPAKVQAVQLSPADQKRADELAANIDFRKDGIESSFGRDAQLSMTDFADGVLSKTRSKDTGEAGDLLRELLGTVDDAELKGVKQIPIIGQVVVSVDKLRRRYQKVAPQVDEIVEKLERAQAQMTRDIAMYDTMYDRNVAQYRQLKIYVTAGKKALADFHANTLPSLEAEVASSQDPMSAQLLKDFKDKLERFSKRLDDLDRVSVVSLQMAPQIKVLQSADKTISDKIDTTISTTIPLWKSQMVIALGLANQRAALDLQHEVDETTNKLLKANAQALHQGAVDAERANQRGSVDIETLQQVNQQLIATLRETMQIQQDGRTKREAAEVQMRQIESDLKQALIENAQSRG